MSARPEIEAINSEFVDAFNKGDAATITNGYAEDCAVLVPNAETVRGKSAVESLFKGMLEEIGGGTTTLEIVEVVEVGDLAYQWANYTLKAKEVSDTGQLVEVFRLQSDGTWKNHRSIFNSDNP